MPDAQLEQCDDRTYFTDADGRRWRVYDVAFGPPHAEPHHYRKFGIGDRRAVNRIFVSATSERRSYAFEKREPRDISAELCTRQLAQAGYLSQSAFDAKSRGPR
jgi:hypothetical protein